MTARVTRANPSHGEEERAGPSTWDRPLLRITHRAAPPGGARRCMSAGYFTAFTRGRFSPSAGSAASAPGAGAAPAVLPMPYFSSTSASTSL